MFIDPQKLMRSVCSHTSSTRHICSSYSGLLLGLLVLGCSSVSAQQDPQRRAAWEASRPLRFQVETLKRSNPEAAIELIEKSLAQEGPRMDRFVRAEITAALGYLYTSKQQAPEKAIALFDKALGEIEASQPPVRSSNWNALYTGKAAALLANKQAKEAETLLAAHVPDLVEAGQRTDVATQKMLRDAFYTWSQALITQRKADQIPGVLEGFLLQAPGYLFLDSQQPGSALWNQFGTSLQKQGELERLLAFAKLRYQTCNFTTADVENATQLLGKAWLAKGDPTLVNTFATAQTDAMAANPLSAVKTPIFSAEVSAGLRSALAELQLQQEKQFRADRVPQIVGLLLLENTPASQHEAMAEAWNLVTEKPDAPEGPLQVCRVFKAVDLNLLRANAFLAYVNGQGPNPVPAYLAMKTASDDAGAATVR